MLSANDPIVFVTYRGPTYWPGKNNLSGCEALFIQIECYGHIYAHLPLTSRLHAYQVQSLTFQLPGSFSCCSRLQMSVELIHHFAIKMILFRPVLGEEDSLFKKTKFPIPLVLPHEPIEEGSIYRLEIDSLQGQAFFIKEQAMDLTPLREGVSQDLWGDRIEVFSHASIAIGDYFLSHLSPLLGKNENRSLLRTFFGSKINFQPPPHKIIAAIEKALLKEIQESGEICTEVARRIAALEELAYNPTLWASRCLQQLPPALGNLMGLMNIIEAGIYAQIDCSVIDPYFKRSIQRMAEASALAILNYKGDIYHTVVDQNQREEVRNERQLLHALDRRTIFDYLKKTIGPLFNEDTPFIIKVKKELTRMGHETQGIDTLLVEDALEYAITKLEASEVTKLAAYIEESCIEIDSPSESGDLQKMIAIKNDLKNVIDFLGGKSLFAEMIAMSLSSLVRDDITPKCSEYLLSTANMFAARTLKLWKSEDQSISTVRKTLQDEGKE